MDRRHLAVELVVAALLVVGAAMLYLEWWRSGELELLSSRVDELEVARRRRDAAPTRRRTPPTSRHTPAGGNET